MKVLLVSFSYPPAAGPGLDRALELAQALPALGIETHVLTREDEGDGGSKPIARMPTHAWVHRSRYIGPAAPAGGSQSPDSGDLAARLASRARHLGSRLLQPDESVTWNLTAIPAAVRLVRAHHIDSIVTVAPPHSLHLVGVAVRRATGAAWLADLAEQPGDGIAWLVMRQADAIACGSDGLAEAMQARHPDGRVSVRAAQDAGSTADLLRSLA